MRENRGSGQQLNARRAAVPRVARRFGLLITALGATLLGPQALAQSWLPEADSFSVTLDTNDTYNKHHYDSHGRRGDFGHTRTFTENLTFSWSPTDDWQLVASVPFVTARYRGAFAHPVRVDDGEYHGTFTDLRVEARHQVIDGAFAMTPFVAIVTPVHDYDVLGHAAQGRGLNELWFGTYMGGSLDEWVPRTYLQLRLNYAFVEHVAGVKHDRINADVEVGCFISPRWSARLLGMWQDTDGGINVPTPITDEHFEHHDQLAATRFFNMGGGLSWSISDSVAVYAVYSTAIHGRNAHMLDSSLSVGVNLGGLAFR